MSGDTFLVDGFATTKTGCATSVSEIEIEDGVIRVHVLGEEDIQAFTDLGMDYYRVRPDGQGTSHAPQALQPE